MITIMETMQDTAMAPQKRLRRRDPILKKRKFLLMKIMGMQ